MRRNDWEGNELKFIVRLCTDVFVETLSFGDRRRLTKFERVGRRLHQIMESFFKLRPFLRLNLAINPGYLIVCYFLYKYVKVKIKLRNAFVYSKSTLLFSAAEPS